MRCSPKTLALAALLSGGLTSLRAQPDWKAVEPVLKAKCYECHNADKTKGDVDLQSLATDPKFASEFTLWEDVKDTIVNGDMPPRKAKPLAENEKHVVVQWVESSVDQMAAASAGDPGPVTMRRLTNAEYDLTIRDLTGHEYGMAKEFQTDGGGGEGFANTGDVLFVNPQQLDKYLIAARKIADFATALPGSGIRFQAQRVGLRGVEQVKAQAEQALYVSYQRMAEKHLPKDDEDLREADYMLACWKHKHATQTGEMSLEKLAKDGGLKLAFLQNWWTLLNGTEPKSRFLDLTRVPWRSLPAPDAAAPKAVPASVTSILNAIQEQRRSWYRPAKNGWASVQRMQQDADGLRSYGIQTDLNGQSHVLLCIGDTGDGNKGDLALVSQMQVNAKGKNQSYVEYLRASVKADKEANAKNPSPDLQKRIAERESILSQLGKHPAGKPIDGSTLAIAAPQVLRLPLPPEAKSFRASCKLDLSMPDAEAATIQWTLAVDKAPDVKSIMPGVLTIWKIQTEASRRTMGDFHVMKIAFPDEYVRRLEEVARNYQRRSAGPGVYYFSDDQLAAIISPQEKKELERMKKDWSFIGAWSLKPEQQKEWDQLILGHLHWFASRAWRRPLSDEEKNKLSALYAVGRTKELDRESAAREVIVRVLVSPHFLFKTETLPGTTVQPVAANKDHPLDSWELASRLSYFLWASLPDETLRQAAADGSLSNPEVLRAQAVRMLKDARSDALGREFAGQWLDFNRFASHNEVDQKKFPEFTPELRAAMFQEVLTFFSHLIREDRNISDIVTADYTFLNARLAKHYSIPGVEGDHFRQVKVDTYHRGGLLGMGSILTKTSRPHRTSPVVRGNYLYQFVLGLSAPPPPANVPKLPENAVKPASLREALKQHSTDNACAVCHERIDPLGFSLESFDPIGRFRAVDESGGKIDDSGELKDGTRFVGLDGLRAYLKTRNDQFTSAFCRKLLGYALGRQTLPSDKPLITAMQQALKNSGGKISAAVATIVTSHQFTHRRTDPSVAGAE